MHPTIQAAGIDMNRNNFVKELSVNGRKIRFYDIRQIEQQGLADIQRLPFSIKILTENLLRKLDGRAVTKEQLLEIANWKPRYEKPVEIAFHPARVLMQDFTGVPAVVDLAAMRDAVQALGGDPQIVNPGIPVEMIIDHSVQIDHYGTADALRYNVAREYERNQERYELLKWAQRNFSNFRVVPPNSGICHQVNLEYLARGIIEETAGECSLAYPDTLIGTDSHTTMINGLGVAGWGVGGIEAEAVMLGQPYYMPIPEVIGVRLTGRLSEGVTATDLVLTVTERLREFNVVEKFVEYFGPGIRHLSIPDRATLANMAPEYGATMGFFPIDEKTIEYLRQTHRPGQAQLTEAYSKAGGLYDAGETQADYTAVIEIELSDIVSSVSGPARPQDRILLNDLENRFSHILACHYETTADSRNVSEFDKESGHHPDSEPACQPSAPRRFTISMDDSPCRIGDGSVVIAAITSCTNTSNPQVMLEAGLLARKAVQKGLKVPAYVKTSMAPGSRVVNRYLRHSGLLSYLEALGFYTAGFGCATCIGNSGPLHPEIEKLIAEQNLNVVSVLSGNRNFEARIHQRIKGNYLMSPPLVVAFALAGRIDIDLTSQPLGYTPNREPVFLKDIWPETDEIEQLLTEHEMQRFFAEEYQNIFKGDDFWQNLPAVDSPTYAWKPASTYIRKPPYFDNFTLQLNPPSDIGNARILLLLGNSVTTDHISPAGAIPADYPAGQFLSQQQVAPADFNSYGSRRGNHEVMMRGTFANIRIKNQLAAPREGGWTRRDPSGEYEYVFDAARQYQKDDIPLLVLAGREYGTGSSRDWAAKGTGLLGIKAVMAESFERIHRSNLVGMGVLPLMFQKGDTWKSLGLEGFENFFIRGLDRITPRAVLPVTAVSPKGQEIHFNVMARLDTEIDVDYFKNGGILPFVVRKLLHKQ
jgi:aconitate hydratase